MGSLTCGSRGLWGPSLIQLGRRGQRLPADKWGRMEMGPAWPGSFFLLPLARDAKTRPAARRGFPATPATSRGVRPTGMTSVTTDPSRQDVAAGKGLAEREASRGGRRSSVGSKLMAEGHRRGGRARGRSLGGGGVYWWWKERGRGTAQLEFEPSRAAAMAAMGVEESCSSSG